MSILKHFLSRGSLSTLLLLSAIGVIVLVKCTQHSEQPPVSTIQKLVPKHTLFLGHKGNGPIGKNDNPGFHENSWKGVNRALELLDGSEIDIQMSKDSTLWLFHDHTIPTCQKDTLQFAALHDSTIIAISQCRFDNSLIKLNDFGHLMLNRPRCSNKELSLDLKVLMNPYHYRKMDTLSLVKLVAQSISSALQGVSYMIEIPEEIPHSMAKNYFNTSIFKIISDPTDQDVNSAKKENYGISSPFNRGTQAFSDFRDKQLWTPNNASDMFHAFEKDPAVIQSDHLELCFFFRRIQQGVSLTSQRVINQRGYELEEEFTNLIDRAPLPKMAVLLKIDTERELFKDRQHIVLAAYNKNNEKVYWESVEATNQYPYFFIAPSLMNRNKAVTYSVYVWNPDHQKASPTIGVSRYSLAQK